jgi:hypothetical protein
MTKFCHVVIGKDKLLLTDPADFTVHIMTESNTVSDFFKNILWYIDPLLGNDCKISSYTTAVSLSNGSVNSGHC